MIENVNNLNGIFDIAGIPWHKVMLPIGISFFTFQSISYAVDVYRGENAPQRRLTNYLLYILSFPQMIAGPIVKYKEIAAQIENRNESVEYKMKGFYRFIIGLAKKVLIANVIGAHADAIFAMEYSEIGSINLWIGALAYTFQIYFDFAGYSDMAIGLGKMMGFKFPENFDSPYASLNISEFWRRWHITLGNFMKDYLYIPLGGNRTSSKFRLYFNLFIVFLLSGFWHGASWNFILWGMFHGLFLILDRLFLVKLLTKLGRFIATLFTFIVVLFGWVLFKIETIGELLIYIENMFNFSSSEEILLDKSIIVSMIVASIFSFLVSFKFGKKISSWFYDMESVSLKKHLVYIGISLFLGFWSISSIVASDFNPFIYFRF